MRITSLIFFLLASSFGNVLAQDNLNYQPSLFNFGMEVNVISFKQHSVDSLNVATGPKLGIRLNQYISPNFDLNFHFLSAKSDPFELNKFIYSQSQFTQLGLDLDYKLNNGYILPLKSRIWPFISAGYTSTSFKKIGDGDDFRIRTNTYGGGAGLSFKINEKIKAHYRIAYRHNFDNYTSNWHNQFGVTFRLFSPIRVVQTEPIDSVKQEPPILASSMVDSARLDSLVDLEISMNANSLETENVNDSSSSTLKEKTRVVALDGKNVSDTGSIQASLLTGNYYVILAAYRNLNSAKTLYTRVGQDVPGTAILETGVDVYRVGVLVGPDSSKANKEKAFFQIHGFPDAWILDNNNPVQPVLKETIDGPEEIAEEIADPDEVIEQHSLKAAEPKPVVIEIPSDSSSTDSLRSETPSSERRIRKEKISNAGIQPGYYIVIASFLDPENALSFRNRLSVLNDDLFIVRAQNGYYRVAKFVGNELQKADKLLLAFKEAFDPGAWLLEME